MTPHGNVSHATANTLELFSASEDPVPTWPRKQPLRKPSRLMNKIVVVKRWNCTACNPNCSWVSRRATSTLKTNEIILELTCDTAPHRAQPPLVQVVIDNLFNFKMRDNTTLFGWAASRHGLLHANSLLLLTLTEERDKLLLCNECHVLIPYRLVPSYMMWTLSNSSSPHNPAQPYVSPRSQESHP